MTDNVTANAGAGGSTFATDQDPVSLAHYPLSKMVWGPLDTFNVVDDVTGKRIPIKLAEVGSITVPISAASLPLPTGASTETTLAGVKTGTDKIPAQGQATMAGSVPVAIASNQSAVPISGTVNIGSAGSLALDATVNGVAKDGTPITGQTVEAGGASVLGWLSSLRKAITDRIGALGQHTMANSTPVVVASDQSAVPVSGTVTANVGTTGGVALDSTLTGGTQKAIPVAGAAGGATPFKLVSAASTNPTSVKGSAGTLYGIQVTSINAAIRYLKLYDKASAPTVGTDTPVKVIGIPGNAAGAGAMIALPVGVAFATGIALALTTGIADADTGAVAASEIAVNLDYK